MRVTVREEKQLIRAESSFIRVHELFESSTLVQLSYIVDLREALKQGLVQVRVSMTRELEATPTITEVGVTNTVAFVERILAHRSLIRETMRANRSKIIHQYVSDISRVVNNELISATIQGGGNTILKRSVRAVPRRQATNVVSGRNVMASMESTGRSSQALALELIQQGEDPSSVATVSGQITSATHLVDGTAPKQHSGSKTLLEYLRAVSAAESVQTSSDDLVYELALEEDSELFINDQVLLPVRLDAFSELFFTFELIDKNGMAVNTVVKKIRTERELSAFRVPKTPPVVKAPKSAMPGPVTLLIKQVDPNAVGVQIYKRILNHSAPLETERYTHVGDFPLTSVDGVRTFTLDIDSAAITCFRVIPVGAQNVLSAEFTNVIIKPNGDVERVIASQDPVIGRRFAHASISTRIVRGGLEIDVRHIPDDAIAIRLYRKDVLPGNTPEVIEVLSLFSKKSVYTFSDTNVFTDRRYEYSCDIVYVDGTVSHHTGELVEYVTLSENLVDTRVENVNVYTDDNNYDVRFSINTKLVPTTLDSVKSALEGQGLISYFNDDILKERDTLQKMIAHNVVRVNLQTGHRETFGIIPTADFSDAELAPVNAVEPLVAGAQYRYEVNTYLRQPETLLTKYEKTESDPVSKRSYTYSPAKYRHPVTLKFGNLTSTSALRAHHANDEFSFGNVGSTVSVDITLSTPPPRISQASANVVNTKNVEVTWKVEPTVEGIEHFLVARVSLDGRQIVGKSHVQQENREFYFIDTLRYGDVGEFTYVIIPVMLDFSKGVEVATNRVYIDPREAPTRELRRNQAAIDLARDSRQEVSTRSDEVAIGIRGITR